MLQTGLSFRVKASNHIVLSYLFIVLAVSIFRQYQIGLLIPREFVVFLVQISSYVTGYRVVQKYYLRRNAEIRYFKYILLVVSIFIFMTAFSNILSGAQYSHGLNIFGFNFLFSPEWPIFSMLCLGAICVLYRSKFYHFIYFLAIFFAANSRAAILIYTFLLMRSSSMLVRFSILALFMPIIYLVLHYNSYLLSRFLEIGNQLEFSDTVSYVESLTRSGLVNENLYRQENLSPTLSACTRIGDLGRIGNTIYGVATAIPYLGVGTGFTLMNMELLCLNRQLFHPAGPAWNPFVYSFIQGGIVGGSLFTFTVLKLFNNIKERDTLFYLIFVLLLSSMITKGLSSYFLWTVLGMLSGYKSSIN